MTARDDLNRTIYELRIGRATAFDLNAAIDAYGAEEAARGAEAEALRRGSIVRARLAGRAEGAAAVRAQVEALYKQTGVEWVYAEELDAVVNGEANGF